MSIMIMPAPVAIRLIEQLLSATTLSTSFSGKGQGHVG